MKVWRWFSGPEGDVRLHRGLLGAWLVITVVAVFVGWIYSVAFVAACSLPLGCPQRLEERTRSLDHHQEEEVVSPIQRVLRTIVQVVIAVAVAVPAAVALLDIDKALAAKIVGVAGALVIVVTAAQNALEAGGVLPKPMAPVAKPKGRKRR